MPQFKNSPPQYQIHRNISRHHGVAIIYHLSLNVNILESDKDHRMLLFSIEGTFGALRIFLGYWPATGDADRRAFTEKHKENIKNADIVMGDFNSCLESTQATWTRDRPDGGLKTVLEGFEDPVDHVSPKDFLYTNHHLGAYSRIDRLYNKPHVPISFLNNLDFPREDSHCPVLFELRTPAIPSPGWRLSPNLFSSRAERDVLRKALKAVKVEGNSYADLLSHCEKIRDTVYTLQRRILRKRRKRICRALDLIKRIPTFSRQRRELDAEISQFAEYNRLKKLSIASKRRIYSNETPDRFLTAKLHNQAKQKSIGRIKHPITGQDVEGEEILGAFEAYYRILYTKVDIEPAVFDAFVHDWKPVVCGRKLNDLAAEFSAGEVEKALSSMKDLKAPGHDGCPALPYKLMTDSSTGALTALFNRLLEGDPVPPDWKEGVITTLFKKGDETLISNRRPITLLPTIYKILTKMIASRINSVLPDLIHEDQVGFIPNRLIFDNVMTADYVMKNHDVWTTSIDFEKAYDSISHECIRRILKHLDFPEKLRNLIDNLITGSKARVRVEGSLTNEFPIERGVKQGDPLSPLLFALCIEPLAHRIRKETKGIQVTPTRRQQILLYADDILLFGESPDDQFRQVKILGDFKKASGLKLNVDKSYRSPDKGHQKSLIRNFEVFPPKEGIPYLGFPIGEKGLLPQQTTITDRVEKAVKKWNYVSWNTILKASVLKTYVLSQIWYFSFIHDMKDQCDQLSRLMADFMWKNSWEGVVTRRVKMRKERAQLSSGQGGLGLFDLEARFKAQLVWIADMILRQKGKISAIWEENHQFSLTNPGPLTNNPPETAALAWKLYHMVPPHCRLGYEPGPQDIPPDIMSGLKEWTGVFSNSVGPILTDRQKRLLETKDVELIRLFPNCKRNIRDVYLRDFAWNLANGTLYYDRNEACPCGEKNRDTEHILFTCKRVRVIEEWIRETPPSPDLPRYWEEGEVLRTLISTNNRVTCALLLGATRTAWLCKGSPFISKNIWITQVQQAMQAEWWYAHHHPDYRTIPKNLIKRFQDCWWGRYYLNPARIPVMNM